MIEIGTSVLNTENGQEGVVVFNPFSHEKGTVSIDHGRGLSIVVVPESKVIVLGKVRVEIGEECKGCIFYNVNREPCARYTQRRFIALHGDHSGNYKEVPLEPYPQCKREREKAMRKSKAV